MGEGSGQEREKNAPRSSELGPLFFHGVRNQESCDYVQSACPVARSPLKTINDVNCRFSALAVGVAGADALHLPVPAGRPILERTGRRALRGDRARDA